MTKNVNIHKPPGVANVRNTRLKSFQLSKISHFPQCGLVATFRPL